MSAATSPAASGQPHYDRRNPPPVHLVVGRWTVTGPMVIEGRKARVPCACACGRTKRMIPVTDFNTGKVQSCRACNTDTQRRSFGFSFRRPTPPLPPSPSSTGGATT